MTQFRGSNMLFDLTGFIFLFPSRSRISGMGFFNSLPVPESSKVIPAHPWGEWDGLSELDECNKLGKYGELVG